MKIKAGIWIWIAAAGCLSLLSITCRAQSNCPWLNVATASGVLGGPATVEVNNTSANTATCVFRLQDGAKKNTLRISVIKVNDAGSAGKETGLTKTRCISPETPLKGVGNEAVLCATDAEGSRGEQVVGRVRDRSFTVTISTVPGMDPEAKPNPLVEKVEEIARSVAGALF